ncbi:MAG: hypothetical protein IT323_19835 [Anaerolineae bacterium]|nr:hypothetical protein [Anaerolineae bacterium]
MDDGFIIVDATMQSNEAARKVDPRRLQKGPQIPVGDNGVGHAEIERILA